MIPTVWLVYNDCNAVQGVCVTAEDCAYYLVENGAVLLDDDTLTYKNEGKYFRYTTIRRAARDMNKPILDFLVDVLKGNTPYWLPWRIEQKRVFGRYEHNLK